LFNLYVPNSIIEKQESWKSLSVFLEAHNPQNIVIAGDLNITINQSEKKGGSLTRDPFKDQVESIMQDWDLLDIKLKKGKFTWSNKRFGLGHISARLDCFLVQSSMLLSGLLIISRILSTSVSDHKPIAFEFS